MRKALLLNLARFSRQAFLGLIVLVVAQVQAFAADRGRPHIQNDFGFNRLLTDKNTALRGVSLGWDGGDNPGGVEKPPVMPSQAQLNALSSVYGFNCIHVYLEKEYQQVGHNAIICDELVNKASAAGLYVIITIGCGNNNGSIRDLNWCRQFWGFYAQRYKDRTHVIFEAHNEPAMWTPGNWSDSDWNNQVALYNAIRPIAPNTHILMCSFMGFTTADRALYGYRYMKDRGVSFSNASIAFHGYENQDAIESCINTFQHAEGGTTPALLCTEFDRGTTYKGSGRTSFNNMLESHFLGWLEFSFLEASDGDLVWVKQAMNDNAVIWTPDFGDWPAHSATQEPINANIKLKAAANGKFVCAENWGKSALIADQWGAGNWETFTLRYRGTNLVALQALVNGQFVCADGAGSQPLIANRPQAGGWETFEWYYLTNGKIALRSCANGRFVTAENGGNSPLIANRTDLGGWEQFTWSY